ncbi:MAG: hypothetical protein ACPG75_03505 [Alloalcanivorax venustensis]
MSASTFRLSFQGCKYKRVRGPYVTVTEKEVTARETIAIKAVDFVKWVTKSMPVPELITQDTSDGSGNADPPLVGRPQLRRLPGAPFLVTEKITIVDPPGNDLPLDPFQSDTDDLTAEQYTDTYNDLLFLEIEYKTKSGGKGEDEEEEDPSDPETFLEYSVDVGGEYMTINPRKAEWEGDSPGAQNEDNQDVQVPAVRVIPTINFNLRWPRVINPPWGTIFNKVGTVSSAVVPFLFNAPAETAMFLGCSGKREFVWWGNDGDPTTNGFLLKPWELDFKFSVKAIVLPGGAGVGGWNHVYRPKKGVWQRLLVGGNPIHPTTATFNDLFLGQA